MDIGTASCEIFIPYFPFVYDVERPINALRRYVDMTIGAQRRSCDPKNLLGNDPRDELWLQTLPGLAHGGRGATDTTWSGGGSEILLESADRDR